MNRGIEGSLQRLLDEAPRVSIGAADRIVILSDLHIGDGGTRDDFRQNSDLVQDVLRPYYLEQGYCLVLNGDIEELQRFRYAAIRSRWAPLFELFEEFSRRATLYKIIGNHDAALPGVADRRTAGSLLDSVRFSFEGTHRPLFESLSRIDTLRFRIEQLCRDYTSASPRARAAIETAISFYRRELGRLWEKDRENGLRSSLYNEQISIPCLFNSGCAIGKRGVTAIEIAGGEIALVHWFDRARGERHMSEDGRTAERLGATNYHRAVLKQDRLQYLFTRIRLLAGN